MKTDGTGCWALLSRIVCTLSATQEAKVYQNDDVDEIHPDESIKI